MADWGNSADWDSAWESTSQCFNSPSTFWSLPGANLGQCWHEFMPTVFSNLDFLHRGLSETRKDAGTLHTSTFSTDLCSSTWFAAQVPPNPPRSSCSPARSPGEQGTLDASCHLTQHYTTLNLKLKVP